MTPINGLGLSPRDGFEPDEVIVLAHGRLERTGNNVDWRGQDGRLVVVGMTNDFDRMIPVLAELGTTAPPELLEWCWCPPQLETE